MKQKILATWEQLKFPVIASLSLWLITYIVTRFVFDVKIANGFQELEVFLTTAPPIFFIIGLSLFVKEKYRNGFTLFLSVLLSLLLAGNVLFYAFYDDFVTLPLLFQSSNMEDLGSSIIELIDWKVIIVTINIIALFFVYYKNKTFFKAKKLSKTTILTYFSIITIAFVTTLGIAYTQRPELLTRSFDRKELVKGLGIYGYQIYDVAFQVRQMTESALADSDQLTETENYLRNRQKVQNNDFFGKYKGKNVIVVSLESTQNFALNQSVNGVEITPFMNSLMKEMYFFENHYHQTGQGKTSDAEFMVDNSMYPLGRGAVFFTNSTNSFNATPGILKKQGYTSAVFHANNKTFWNRNVIYNSFGYDRYFNANDYTITEDNSVGWGLKDKEFFEQSVDMLKDLKQPFYTRFLTLTNHFPFDLNEEDIKVPSFESGDATVDKYFQTLRYEDEALKLFVDKLKESGIWDNSVVIFYGDHYGISENHNKAMAKFLNKEEITRYDHIQLQKTPLFVHLPGQTKGKVMTKVVGQVDIRPTILNLLGVKDDSINFGTDLFANEKDHMVVLRDGSFVTDKYIYTQSTFYDRNTGEEVEVENGEKLIQQAISDLDNSDKVITTDLLRFYKNSFDSKDFQTEMK